MIPLGRPSGGIPVSVRAVLFLFCMSCVMFHLEKGSAAKEIQTPPPNNNELLCCMLLPEHMGMLVTVVVIQKGTEKTLDPLN